MSDALSVLVVDDDVAISSLMRVLIVGAGGEVWNTFESGEAALAAIGRQIDAAAAPGAGRSADAGSARSDDVGAAPCESVERLPDLALLDVFLPGIDGIELGRRLHAMCPTLRVVLVSSMEPDDLPSDALSSGVSEFVPKAELGPDRIRHLLRA